ncbi:hypothetical protein BJ322DRAFT_1020528 [Thelephora terrestris]|uniref:Uncharacterized protein n=1 Tax=Thelephora terrestris TaxID=56493 RepID=A0A9P6HIA6_9AGAM|nr:hypothetical protein BJ322DRAFT_1020528 [Thelephora terrestris]
MAYQTRNHTSDDAPTQGSTFHELVVLPTFAPHLARPYRVPGTEIVYNTEFMSQTQERTDTHSDAPNHTTGDAEAGSREEQVVGPGVGLHTPNDLNVALEKQPTTGRNGKSRAPKQHSRTKVHPLPIPALRYSRAEFIHAILTAHNLQNRFQAHSESGPDFRISWKGSVGGKSAAPTIQIDEDWKKLCEDLARQPFSCVVDLSVTLDSGCLSPQFEKGSLPNELDNDEEIFLSTKVPEVEDFSQDTQVLASIIDELKTEWNCTADGPCYVTSNGQHVPLTKFRLSGWASEIDSPSDALLIHWGVTPSLPVKPRGRAGPNVTTSTAPAAPTVDPVVAMFTVMAPLVTTLMAQQLKSIPGLTTPSTPHRGSKQEAEPTSPTSRSPKRAQHSQECSSSHHVLSPSPPPSRPSSPLPGVEHELESCMLAFGKSKALADDIISSAIDKLSTLGYTPDVLADNNITNEQVGQVSGLPEGTVSALRKFSCGWCAELEVNTGGKGVLTQWVHFPPQTPKEPTEHPVEYIVIRSVGIL